MEDQTKTSEQVLDDAIAKALQTFSTMIDEKITGMKAQYPSIFVTPSENEEKEQRRGGFASMNEFVKTIIQDKNDNRLKALYNETVGSDGGFLVPEEWRSQYLEGVLEQSNFFGRATKIPMRTNSITIPAIVSKDNSSNLYGGVSVYWVAEGATGTESAGKFDRVQLSLHDVIALFPVTNDLLQDSPESFAAVIDKIGTEAMAFELDEVALNGLGVGKPLGCLYAPCTISVAKETGQAADTIVADNIINMYSRLPAASKRNAVWVANHNTFPQIYKLSMSIGTGGVPLFVPASAGMVGAPFGTLLGRPIIFNEHSATVGDTGDIMLIDWSQYLVGEKIGAGAGLQKMMSEHLYFNYNRSTFRIVYRCDGQPWWQQAFQPKSGSTLSPVIKLDERA